MSPYKTIRWPKTNYYDVVGKTCYQPELATIHAYITNSYWTQIHSCGSPRVSENGKTQVFRGFQQMSITSNDRIFVI